MAAFCEISDLEAFLQVEIGDDNASATAAIAAASAAIQDYCRQALEQVEDDALTLTVPAGRYTVLLPEQPVTAVESVVENGATLTVGTEYRWTRAGVLTRVGRTWSTAWEGVVITYTHGYADIPIAVRDVCVRAAARAYQAGLRAAATGGVVGVQSEQTPEYSVNFGASDATALGGMLGASAAPMLLPSEKTALARYRMPV